jgi:hypothetical protein
VCVQCSLHRCIIYPYYPSSEDVSFYVRAVFISHIHIIYIHITHRLSMWRSVCICAVFVRGDGRDGGFGTLYPSYRINDLMRYTGRLLCMHYGDTGP